MKRNIKNIEEAFTLIKELNVINVVDVVSRQLGKERWNIKTL